MLAVVRHTSSAVEGVGEVIVAIRESWVRVDAWLSEHACFVLDTLNPGATPEAVRAAQGELGAPALPDDFVQSWLLHNGQRWNTRLPLVAGSLGSYALLPLDQVTSHWQTWTDLLGDFKAQGVRGVPRGPVRANWWNKLWVPVGVNGSGDMICLDLDPPKRGTVGQVIEILHEDGDRTVLAPSLGAWLERFAADLEAGRYRAFDATHDRYYGLVHTRDL